MVKFKQVSINQIIPEHAGDFFEGDAEISGFFTNQDTREVVPHLGAPIKKKFGFITLFMF
jgi:hypothetical protein